MAKQNLTKKEVISRLQKTVKKLKALPNRNFDYSTFVSESEELKNGSTCGTVCCAAGWYPLWFPKAGLIWKNHTLESKKYGNDYHAIEDALVEYHGISDALVKYHGISDDLVDVLFYGQTEYFESNNKFIDGYHIGLKKKVDEVNKNDLIQLFEFVIDLIRKNEIDYKL